MFHIQNYMLCWKLTSCVNSFYRFFVTKLFICHEVALNIYLVIVLISTINFNVLILFLVNVHKDLKPFLSLALFSMQIIR